MERGKDYGVNDISFKLLSKDMNRVLHMFAPGIEIANESGFSGSYNSSTQYLDVLFSSPKVSYGDFVINDIYGSQRISNDSIFSDYIVEYLIYNDSLQLNQIEFYTDGTKGMLNSRLSWAPGTDEESQIYWDTKIHDNDHMEIILKPSFFTLDGFSWNVVNESDISITTEDIHINKFELKREDQLITINGCVSENDFDKLNFNLMNLNTSELGTILGLENKCNVFCEKPPGRTVEEVRLVKKTFLKYPKLKLKYGFNHRYHESVKKAYEYIRNIIKYKGILISDDIEMSALSGTIEDKVLSIINAGFDIILHCSGNVNAAEEVLLNTPLLGKSLSNKWKLCLSMIQNVDISVNKVIYKNEINKIFNDLLKLKLKYL